MHWALLISWFSARSSPLSPSSSCLWPGNRSEHVILKDALIKRSKGWGERSKERDRLTSGTGLSFFVFSAQMFFNIHKLWQLFVPRAYLLPVTTFLNDTYFNITYVTLWNKFKVNIEAVMNTCSSDRPWNTMDRWCSCVTCIFICCCFKMMTPKWGCLILLNAPCLMINY